MNAGSGPVSPTRSAEWRHDPGCSCLRMSPGCSLSTGGQPYPRSSERFPSWGTWDATGFTALPKPEPPTYASAGSALLPTPRASDGPHGGPQQTGTGLIPVISKLFLTPTFTDSKGSRNSTANRSPGSTYHNADTLTDALVKLFPTPTEACGKGGQTSRSGNRRNEKLLNGIVQKLFPTPNASDHKGPGQRPGRTRDGRLRLPCDADLPTAVTVLFPTPAARDWKGTSLRGAGTIRSDTGKPRTARQADLPSALRDLTGRNTSPPSAAGN